MSAYFCFLFEVQFRQSRRLFSSFFSAQWLLKTYEVSNYVLIVNHEILGCLKFTCEIFRDKQHYFTV